MWAIPVVSLCHRFTFGSLFSYQNLRNFPCPTLCRDTGLHPQINPDTKLNCSTAVTKGSWDRLSNPATGRCKWKPTSPRKWCSDLSWVLYALVFSSGATLHAQTQDKVLEQAASASSRVKKVRQLGCKANKWKECGSAVLPTPCWLLKWKNSLGAGGKPPAWQCGLITEGYETHADLDGEVGVKEEKKKWLYSLWDNAPWLLWKMAATESHS